MKNLVKALIVVALTLGLLPSDLFALGGRLSSPVLVISKPAKPGVVPSMNLAPQDEHHSRLFEGFADSFASGYFINWMTWLYFSGDEATLNRMLAELSEAEGLKFNVRFSTQAIAVTAPFKNPDDEAERDSNRGAHWMVHHDASSQRIWVTIHSGEGGVDLERLVLPMASGSTDSQRSLAAAK